MTLENKFILENIVFILSVCLKMSKLKILGTCFLCFLHELPNLEFGSDYVLLTRNGITDRRFFYSLKER